MGTLLATSPAAADVLDAVRHDACPLTGDAHDYDALLDRIGDDDDDPCAGHRHPRGPERVRRPGGQGDERDESTRG